MDRASYDEIQLKLLKADLIIEFNKKLDEKEIEFKKLIPEPKKADLPSGFWWIMAPLASLLVAFFWYNVNSVNALSKQFSDLRIDIVKLENKIVTTKRVSTILYKKVAPYYGLQSLSNLNRNPSNLIDKK